MADYIDIRGQYKFKQLDDVGIIITNIFPFGIITWLGSIHNISMAVFPLPVNIIAIGFN